MSTEAEKGVSYFFTGVKLLFHPRLWHYVWIPLLINTLLFGALTLVVFSNIGHFVQWIDYHIPHWLSWLAYFVWAILAMGLILILTQIFSSIAATIAAPFNSLLSKKTQEVLTGNYEAPEKTGIAGILYELPKGLGREWTKFGYFVPRAVALFLLFLVPGLGWLTSFIWYFFVSWMMAIQYLDYPFENNKLGFEDMRRFLHVYPTCSYSFGIICVLFFSCPILNLIAMPAAVIGGTACYVEKRLGVPLKK